MIPGNPMYYQVPMGIIGKVYANSLMVLLNSRMSLTSSENTGELGPMEFKRNTEVTDSNILYLDSTFEDPPSHGEENSIVLSKLSKPRTTSTGSIS